MAFAWHGRVGLLLIAIFWPLNWLLEGPRTHWGFFPLWLGFCLTVDAINLRRRGTSLLTRSVRGYVGLFAISVPVWWLFEAINLRTRNWEYVGGEFLGPVAYALLASLSFSTVVPAVLGTAELFAGFGWIRRLGRGPRLVVGPRGRVLMLAGGLVMLALLLVWPRYFYPGVWLSVYFLCEPVNAWLGNRTLLERLSCGDWRPVVALACGVLTCGLFWEGWNYLSYPKWVYHVPFFGFARVFEMPLAGYLGYVPFALELYALVYLAAGLTGRPRSSYVLVGLAPEAAARNAAASPVR